MDNFGQLLLIFVTIGVFSCGRVVAWDNEELELFDLVDEVNKNFYEVLEISQDATLSEIKRAYRRQTIKKHPDKNPELDTEKEFRELVAVYEVLKDEERRKQYDHILEYGLPDWRQPVFYYRRVRKLGILETSLMLMLIISVGHFLTIWAIYFERRYEMEEILNARRKKEKKGKKAKLVEEQQAQYDTFVEEELKSIPRPTWSDLIPCRIVLGIIAFTKGTVMFAVNFPSLMREMQEERKRRQEEAEQEAKEEDDSEEEKVKKVKRKRVAQIPEFTPEEADDKPVSYTAVIAPTSTTQEVVTKKRSGKEWTDEEVSMLAKAVAKFPSGTMERWEKVANTVGRTVPEVISKSKQIQSGYAIHVDPSAQGQTGAINEKVSFKKGKSSLSNVVLSERTDWPETSEDTSDASGASSADSKQNTSDGAAGSKKNRRSAKPAKNTERTLMISKPDAGAKVETNERTDGGVGAATQAATPTEAPSLIIENRDIVNDGLVWSQNQQKILEWALKQFPNKTPDRWDKIAEHIPGKRKEDCIARFKYLADIVKKKKQEQAAAAGAAASS